MKKAAGLIVALSFLVLSTNSFASRLIEVKVIDKDYIMARFFDGEVLFVDDGLGSTAYTSDHNTANNYKVLYGSGLNTANAVLTANWVIKSADDANYGGAGLNPLGCFRKSKLNGMAEMDWSGSDFVYDHTMEHTIYLRLPHSMVQGSVYTVEMNANTNSDVLSQSVTFNIFSSRSESVHVNVVGYPSDASIKAADLYIWMGNGGARDYATFAGKKVYIYNVDTDTAQEVGTVALWKNSTNNDVGWFNLTASNVWKADFTGFNTPGTYRLAIEGVGCSEDFEIKRDIYFEPFRVSTLGFFYMRIGQNDRYGTMPVPRRPLYIAGVSPANTKVYITTMQPWHAQWDSFSGGDKWDNPPGPLT
ncbi:MAG: hypothetical protein LLF76_10225 [Planctomycetaceae bacterium]|nr:hypothetical protein [Planctomycetaceae bacterium]